MSETYYMTPNGYNTLSKELEWLLREERPRITEIVSWAAGNGDRSENGDYIYNKKRLREIDRRVRYLTKKLENTNVVDAKDQVGVERIYFGATVTYLKDDGSEQTVQLVDVDEADLDQGKMNWKSPLGQALFKKEEGDVVFFKVDGQRQSVEVLEVEYLTE